MKQKNIQNLQNSKNSNSYNKAYSQNSHLVKKKIFGIDITNATKEEILEYIVGSLKISGKNYYITTPNPEMIVYASNHPEFQSILNKAEIALCDGAGLLWGAKVVATPIKERFTGVELVEKLCEKANKQPITIGFFGGKPGVAELAAECLSQKYSSLKVVYTKDTWDEEYLEANVRKSEGSMPIDKANKPSTRLITTRHSKSSTITIDILFVALGFPKQEEWMASHVGKIPVRVMVGVGGALDYLSGKVHRAPKWVQNIGMEWAFRLVLQPWRIKRQLALPKFVWIVAKEKFRRV